MKTKTYSLSEIKAKHKKAGGFFFQRGLPPVIAKKGNMLMTKGFGGGYAIYKFYPKTGKIQFSKFTKTKKWD